MSGPLPARPNDDARPAREQLEQLLTEINALAIGVKRAALSRERRRLPPAARGVLQLLQRHGPMSVPALALARGTSRQNIQIIANRLTKAGWAITTSNPAHKRSDLVCITVPGSSMLESGRAAHAELLETLRSATSQREVISSLELMQRLREALRGKPPAAVPPEPPRTKPAHQTQSLEPELPVNLL